MPEAAIGSRRLGALMFAEVDGLRDDARLAEVLLRPGWTYGGRGRHPDANQYD